VGRSVAELDVGPGRLTGRLDHASNYTDVDRATGTVPAYVSGTVQAAVGDVDAVAVVVDGTVAGWSELHSDSEGRSAWWTMVPEWLLENGANRIELYEVTGTIADPVLSPIALG
jgi:hypothetical protein